MCAAGQQESVDGRVPGAVGADALHARAPCRPTRSRGAAGLRSGDPDVVDAVLEEAAKFASEVLAPINALGDREGVSVGERRRGRARGLLQGIRAVSRRGLDGHRREPGVRRPGPAQDGGGCLRGNVEQREHGVRALPRAEPGRDAGRRASRVGGAPRDVSRADDRGPLDGVDVPDRAAGGFRARGPDHARRAARRSLPAHRPQDLHHVGRSPDDGEHRPSGSRARAGCAGRLARPLALRRAEVPAPEGWLARRAQRRPPGFRRAQARDPREPDLRACVRRSAAARRVTSSAARTKVSPPCSR